jgi:hypothetical protein
VLRQVAEERLAALDRLVHDYFDGVDAMEPVGRSELLKRARSGNVLVLDVRPREEFQAGHIAGALSIPLSMLEKRLSEIPRGATSWPTARDPIVFWPRRRSGCYAGEGTARFVSRRDTPNGEVVLAIAGLLGEWGCRPLPMPTTSKA